MIDVRFPTALQMMLSLALAQSEGVPRLSSSKLAAGVESNPTFVRKLLTPLLETGLIVSTAGRDGGISLAHPPDAITIAAIYQASTGLGPFWSPRENIPHRCIVSCNFNNFFADLAAAADRAVRSELAEQTLADALNDLRARERLRSRRRRTD